MIETIRKERGVTLIALVITIIVLLILAGIAISMLSGENGILNQVAKARETTETKSTEEEVKLAAIAAMANSHHKIEDKEKLEEELNKYGLKLDEREEGKEIPGSWTVTKDNKIYEITCYGEVKQVKVPASDYGAIVTNYEVGNANYKDENIKWRIFLDDGDNVYLIANDCVSLDKIPPKEDKKPLNTNEKYPKSAFLNEIVGKYKGTLDILSNTKIPSKYNVWAYEEKNREATMGSIKSIAYLVDTEIWDVYAGDNAYFAIGAPTLEMLFESYNNIHLENQLEYDGTTSRTGYLMKYTTAEKFDNNSGISYANDKDSLYVLWAQGNGAYWLASGGAYAGGDVLRVTSERGMIYYAHFDPGFRPVICLKSDVKLEKQSDGTYLIK